jgi:hypothetical protein
MNKLTTEKDEFLPDDPGEHIRKPPPDYKEDKTSYYLLHEGKFSLMGSVKAGQPLPPGAKLIRGPSTTIEVVRELLHPATKRIADDDKLWRLAYAIDLERFRYALGKGARKGELGKPKQREDQIALQNIPRGDSIGGMQITPTVDFENFGLRNLRGKPLRLPSNG